MTAIEQYIAIKQYILTRYHIVTTDAKQQMQHIKYYGEGSGFREGYLRMANIHDVADEVSDIYNLPFRLSNSMCWQVAHDHIDTFKPLD